MKKYFFSLDETKLHAILRDYEREFGESARKYAEFAMGRWKSGRVKMSGLVASRLFALLPKHMDAPTKYSLVQNLWKHFCPKSKKVFDVLPTSKAEDLVREVEAYFDEVINRYEVPTQLKQRFVWLYRNDATAYEAVLNQLLAADKQVALASVKAYIPAIIENVQKSPDVQHLSRVVKVGQHEVELRYRKPPTVLNRVSWGAVFWLGLLGWLVVRALLK